MGRCDGLARCLGSTRLLKGPVVPSVVRLHLDR
jgi:hypothetical protein